ncbi:MAG: PTS sugar transporter subunit IIA [Candidatus Eisenbacteria bacterium]|nr:PTS sugar transporter subunit IIA [Candidatus Eisenbacteria bacterium]
MNLTEVLDERAINLALDGTSLEEIVGGLVDLLAATDVIIDRETVIRDIMRREEVMSTGIGGGIAIPHAQSKGASRLAVALGRSRGEVDFNSLDGRPVQLFFLVVGPEERGGYIRVLARISRLLYSGELQRRLGQARHAADAMALVRAEEERVTHPA